MVLKTEKLKLENGKEITIKELSFAGQMRIDAVLSEKKHLCSQDLYKECVEPWEEMEQVGREEAKKILEIYNKLNPIEEPAKDQ